MYLTPVEMNIWMLQYVAFKLAVVVSYNMYVNFSEQRPAKTTTDQFNPRRRKFGVPERIFGYQYR